MDKESEIVAFVRERYQEEQDRFQLIEQKAMNLMAQLTFALAVVGALFKLKHESLLSPISCLEIALTIIAVVTVGCLFLAWAFAMFAVRVGKFPIAANSRENAEYMLSVSDEELQEHLVDCYVDPIAAAKDVLSIKVTRVERSFMLLTVSAVFLLIFCTLTLIEGLLA